MPGGYGGRLLAVAISGDGRRAAAAGEAVPAEQLQPLESARRGGPAPVRRRRGPRGGAVGLDALAAGGGMFEQLSLGGAPDPCGEGAARAPIYTFEQETASDAVGV
jgi:hypothetical protein